jgi:ribonucleoside-diphosphate reductase alpha chain
MQEKSLASTTTAEVPMQPASLDIWSRKYQLKSVDGEIIDADIEAMRQRVVDALIAVDSFPNDDAREQWRARFTHALRNGAIPAGRILSNAGAEAHKPKTSTINCTVSGTIPDSMLGILEKATEAGLTLKSGAGIGYEFSTLRPSGAIVAGAGAATSGPLSFMDVFDRICATVSSAGSRRGAQMATFDVSHPDVEAFIKAKREDGRLRQFNCSLLITESFLDAVANDADWPLVFPVLPSEASKLDLDDPNQVVWREWPNHDASYIIRDDGLVACKVYRSVRARQLWDTIMASTYDFAEPGFILIDRVNEMNNNWWCESIRATNPCGEQPLPPYGSCLLGSVDLTRFVRNPFTSEAWFDWEAYEEVVYVFARMLDNVVEINGLALPEQRKEILSKRRHGMGYLGLGSTFVMLGMRYGSPESVAFTEKVTLRLAVQNWKAGLDLGQEKGIAPILDDYEHVDPTMLRKRPEMVTDGYKLGDIIETRVLWGRYSRYFQQLATVEPELVSQLIEKGARFTHSTSIAPTGTISLSLANNASNGIEPSFAHHYARNVIVEGRNTKEKVDVYSFELLAYRHLVNPNAMPGAADAANQLPSVFLDASDVLPSEHIAIQAAAQRWVDSSISKTVNVATEISFADFQEVYFLGARAGLKGCTTFRFNPAAFQGVLVKESDLAATTYRFELEDGTVVEAKGNDQIEYDGAMHTAANLYDALKEGTYGKQTAIAA